ncbi:hypothetical protein QQ045_014399 [Rhodiola kirilowii]
MQRVVFCCKSKGNVYIRVMFYELMPINQHGFLIELLGFYLGNYQSLSTRLTFSSSSQPLCLDTNLVWDEDLTLFVVDPNVPVLLIVYDTFSKDDKMGDTEFDIKPYLSALKVDTNGLPSETILSRKQSSRNNCLLDVSCITWKEDKIVEDMILRLRNVKCGEVELQLQWIELPGSKGLSL